MIWAKALGLMFLYIIIPWSIICLFIYSVLHFGFSAIVIVCLVLLAASILYGMVLGMMDLYDHCYKKIDPEATGHEGGRLNNYLN